MNKIVIESNDTSEPIDIDDEFVLDDEIPTDIQIHILGQEASDFLIDDDMDYTDDFDFDLDEPSELSESDVDDLSQDQLSKDIHERMLKVRSEATGKVPPTVISISQPSTNTPIKVSHI